MKRPWLLIDSNYLAYRSYYSMGHLTYNEVPTGVLYGFLGEVTRLLEHFSTDRIAFCFDYGVPLRKADFPGYKVRDENKTDEELKKIRAVKQQTNLLRREYLAALGYRNILFDKGYEADDVLASLCRSRQMSDLVIVSSDKDLYQLLAERVSIWNPASKELITLDSFARRYGITPEAWKDVKALAGCDSDKIPGIKGVGEATAIKFLTGHLKKGVKFEAIIKANKLWRRNLSLVSLPYGGVKRFDLVRDAVTLERWEAFVDQFGMKSLREFIPGNLSRRALSRSEL